MKGLGVRGFTLIELVVTMLISSLVVLIAFSSYEIVSHQFLDYRKKSGQVAQAELLNMLLEKDFTNSKNVMITPDSNLQFTYSNAPDVKYNFTRNTIIRVVPNIIADTFKFSLCRITRRFEGKSLVPDHYLIDEISFEAKILS